MHQLRGAELSRSVLVIRADIIAPGERLDRDLYRGGAGILAPELSLSVCGGCKACFPDWG